MGKPLADNLVARLNSIDVSRRSSTSPAGSDSHMASIASQSSCPNGVLLESKIEHARIRNSDLEWIATPGSLRLD